MLLAFKRNNQTTHNAPKNTPDGFEDPTIPEHVSAPSRHQQQYIEES